MSELYVSCTGKICITKPQLKGAPLLFEVIGFNEDGSYKLKQIY